MVEKQQKHGWEFGVRKLYCPAQSPDQSSEENHQGMDCESCWCHHLSNIHRNTFLCWENMQDPLQLLLSNCADYFFFSLLDWMNDVRSNKTSSLFNNVSYKFLICASVCAHSQQQVTRLVTNCTVVIYHQHSSQVSQHGGVWHKQHVQADADGWWIRSGMSKDQSMGQIQPLNFHRPAGSLKKSGICGFSKNLLWLWIWSHGPSVTVSGSFLKMSTENKKEKLTVRATTSRTSGNWHLFSVKYERTLSAQCAKRLWLLSRSSISKGWQDMLTTTS